ncbi:glucose/arabinose dehydrogenase [Curtobacterium sp. PhB130]|uniref:PQQ-dependent sugar dehydrogenase n=1 Tax=unclassified Curtobacterium TaxID=257496 RepID=UPI000F4D26B5|nr:MULTISPECIES: PQQ-dependent sugar dehydrogenase [unclassified Curtobacterium]ROS78053.1 glucose/arabinose dehydrogenase [Curtobacterium sp. PhB130]TCK65630.1 glucose/arabinose dehydrogenase [Curtobacterium sp. PhB136]
MRTRTASPLVVLTLVALTLSGCTAGSDADDEPTRRAATAPPTPTDLADGEVVPTGAVTDVATGLDAPWSVVLTDDGTPLVSLRDSGDVLELGDDGTPRTVGSIDGVSHGGEGGLLGLALHDDALYVYSTADDGNRVQRYPLTGSAGSFALGDPTTVIDELPANTFHDGGRIAFGPDDMLYVTVGDAGNRSEAQDRSSLAGKILRLTPTGDVPDDNPFDGSPVWSYGHRNVQGLGWASDGTMFASEFGEDTWDELNVIEPGKDYGWPEVEGAGGTSQGFVDPVRQWSTDAASPSGLAVVDDTVFIANLRGEVLRSVPAADPSDSREWFSGEYGRLRTVLAGPDGTLWFVTNNTDGRGTPGAGDDRILSVGLTG